MRLDESALSGIPNIDPTPSPALAYTRFLAHLMNHGPAIEALFDRLVEALADDVPDFGERLVVDSKAIPSWATRPSKNAPPEGRREPMPILANKSIGASGKIAPPGPKS